MRNKNEYKTFKANQRIITKNDDATECYLITKGKVRVFLEKETKQVELAVLQDGEIFGETTIFSGETYGANVEAIEDTTALIITPETFQDMLADSDPTIRALLRMLINRLRQTNAALLKSETRAFMDIGFV